jgi:aspartate 1-decarboxylase
MQIEVLKSKIHRAVITEANLNYVGSITIDEDLIDAANIIENEKVQVVNVNNGKVRDLRDSGKGFGYLLLNGPAARKEWLAMWLLSFLMHRWFDEAKNLNHGLYFQKKAIKYEARDLYESKILLF